MKTKLYLLTGLIFISFIAYAQYPNIPGEIDFTDDVVLLPEKIQIKSSRTGSAEDLYNNLNTWIPSLSPSEPLKNPPIMYVEISFHVFLDDNGGNSNYMNTSEGHERLMNFFNHVNNVYSGSAGNGPSDPVAGVTELPNYDTRIRFTLGDNNERIYFYNNTEWNKKGGNAGISSFYNYIKSNYPERSNKLNIYFTSGHREGKVSTNRIIIDNAGSGYTSAPTITFSPSGATATATVENGKLTAITIVNGGSYNGYDPPLIIINGGSGTGASAHVTRLLGGTSGQADMPTSSLSKDIGLIMYDAHSDKLTFISDINEALPHELGHTLDLYHTYCGGGASVVGCLVSCGLGCTVDCSKKDYLFDIFGVCPNSTCPHIHPWSNPFDTTLLNAEKITNNVMGGNFWATYISSMQAGQIHRALALKSTRKYVKKETYSPIPLVINSSQVWDFNLKLYRDIT
ncbi:MAG: hypothetical protein LBU84_10610, partial [Prevotella sp.]|nr:hypothetical protein [Prevotella sp.]